MPKRGMPHSTAPWRRRREKGWGVARLPPHQPPPPPQPLEAQAGGWGALQGGGGALGAEEALGRMGGVGDGALGGLGGGGVYGRPASPLLLLRLLESSLCSKGVNTGRYATKPGKEATKL
jgi:hypothetical protein